MCGSKLHFVFAVFRDEGVVAPRLSSNCTRKRITSARTSVPGCTISRADAWGDSILLSQVPGTLSHEFLFFNLSVSANLLP